MKNILDQKPSDRLNARLKFSLNLVKDEDIKNKKILDIGCGFGWFELNALKRGAKEVIGIEISEEDLKAAKNDIQDKRAKFKVAGALKLPFPDNYFDTVVCWEVVEHIPKGTENKMFKEVARVLKKNGKFYLSTPYDSFFSKFFDPAWWLMGHRHYSDKYLENLGEREGFRINHVYIKGGFWCFVNLWNLYLSKWVFRRVQFFEDFFDRVENKEFRENGFMGIFIQYEKG